MFNFFKFKIIKNVYVKFQCNGPVSLLKERINSNCIRSDELQLSVVQELQSVYENIQNYIPTTGNSDKLRLNAPKGLYIYGSVGGGKTMLMDLFYESCKKIDRKQRIHFNKFMSEVHSNIHKIRLNMPKRVLGEKPAAHFDFIKPVADIITESSWLICFDEFQVTDIADAMILKRLFTHLFENGVIVVATSNRSPDDLYRNGLQRRLFLQFIEILTGNCNVMTLNNVCDYRADALLGSNSGYYYVKSEITMNQLFKRLCLADGSLMCSKTLNHMGRSLTFDKTCGRILDVNFDKLCDRPLGASDYIKIAENFKTIFLRKVPQLNLQELKLQTRRFTILIDVLYDYRIRVVISSDVEFKELFSSKIMGGCDDEDRILMDDLKIVKNSTNNSSNIFTERIEEQIFAFNRTISRLSEMQTNEYWMKWKI